MSATCTNCSGSGEVQRWETPVCPSCRGNKYVPDYSQVPSASDSYHSPPGQVACNQCQGSGSLGGRMASERGTPCGGSGTVPERYRPRSPRPTATGPSGLEPTPPTPTDFDTGLGVLLFLVVGGLVYYAQGNYAVSWWAALGKVLVAMAVVLCGGSAAYGVRQAGGKLTVILLLAITAFAGYRGWYWALWGHSLF